jgi:hypothetical protein
MNVTLVSLVLELTLDVPLKSPAAPFAIRTFFPVAFRLAADRLNEPAWWEATFGQQLSPDPEAVRRYQKPPLPFVFDLPALPAGCRGTVELGLTLVGSAVNHLAAYILALRLLFADEAFTGRFPARLDAIAALDAAGSRTLLWRHGGEPQLSEVPFVAATQLIDREQAMPDHLHLEILTPLRLLQDGRPCREPGFSLLARSLMRRVSALAYYYCREELDMEFRWLAERSASVATVRSELCWAEWGGGVQGVVGRIEFRGELIDFLPFFRLGERLHAGKGASFGLGRYSILAELL